MTLPHGSDVSWFRAFVAIGSAAVTTLIVTLATPHAHDQRRSQWDGVYSDAQAARGRTVRSDTVAYMLSAAGYPSGSSELSSDPALLSTIVIRASSGSAKEARMVEYTAGYVADH